MPLEQLAQQAADHPADREMLVLLAERSLAQREPARAEEAMRLLLEKDPGDARAWLLRSRAELDQNHLPQAYASVQVAKPLAAGNPEVPYVLGQILERQGDEQEAEARYRETVALDPTHTGARLELARFALAHRHYGPAREHLEAILKRIPTHVIALELLSNTLRFQGELPAAEKLARRATVLAPRSSRAWNALALVLQARALPAPLVEAEAAFRKVLELDSESADAHTQLGRLLFNRGDYRAAIRELESALRIHGLNRLPYPLLMQCYRRVGEPAKAAALQREYEKINDMDLATAPLEYSIYAMPDNVGLRLRLARLYATYGRPDLARDQVERVLRINPRQGDALRMKTEYDRTPSASKKPE